MATTFKLNTLVGCQEFVDTQSPNVIVDQILQDQKQCRNQGIPSLLVHCLPRHTDRFAKVISADGIPLAIARMRFASIVSTIKAYLANLSRSPPSDPIPDYMIPTDADFTSTLKVLTYLQLPQTNIFPDPSTSLASIVENVKAQLSMGADLRRAVRHQHPMAQKNCYMCRYLMTSPHPLYPSLCIPCGDFNISSSSLSLPPSLDLAGKTALVTGGRINLGYHTALRLLRCGTKVVVSSRYPKDAYKRYLSEQDSDTWKERLKIVGADFRAAKDVFSLVRAVIACLRDWSVDDKPKLDILINNAAQTLTDSVKKEGESIQRELHLTSASSGSMLLDYGYMPRVRGGVGGYQIVSSPQTSSSHPFKESPKDSDELIASSGQDAPSSWIQRLSEIPYEDVISAHSVNTFVPFILVRELLPYMSNSISSPQAAKGQSDQKHPNPKPAAYIVNVSSREGIFEGKPGQGAKAGHHVHTNMSKAALNMLTETEAESAWKNGRVAMNTVDPGYMSADAVYMEMVGRAGQECPIGWEDGAGRVLWPVARGEQGHIVRGRFLKHFAEVDVTR